MSFPSNGPPFRRTFESSCGLSCLKTCWQTVSQARRMDRDVQWKPLLPSKYRSYVRYFMILYAYMKTYIYIIIQKVYVYIIIQLYVYKCCSIMFFHDLPFIYLIVYIFWKGILHEINRPGAWESERYTDLESSPQRLGGASIDGFPVAPGRGMSCWRKSDGTIGFMVEVDPSSQWMLINGVYKPTYTLWVGRHIVSYSFP